MSVCKKRSYLTKREAKDALESIERVRNYHAAHGGESIRAEYRFYKCPNCGTYHLSSHPE